VESVNVPDPPRAEVLRGEQVTQYRGRERGITAMIPEGSGDLDRFGAAPWGFEERRARL
jgi:hypothetical protein